ncbi:MAG: hypothetical protein AAGJ50_12020 [Pseudomonadota bacterium]
MPALSSQRRAELMALARNPRNFVPQRTNWQRLSEDEKEIVIRAMDNYYDEDFTNAFVGFADRGRLDEGRVIRDGRREARALFTNNSRRMDLFRTPAFQPILSSRSCRAYIYPDGLLFEDCSSRPRGPTPEERAQERRINRANDRALAAWRRGDVEGIHEALDAVESDVEAMVARFAANIGMPVSSNLLDTIFNLLGDERGDDIPDAIRTWYNFKAGVIMSSP